MKIFKSICEFQEWRTIQKISSLGFVPTMGALHEGHLSLIKKSKRKCNITVVSIFINQLQFSPSEDFNSYPKTVNHDLKKLKDYNVDIVFMPNTQDMYQNDFTFQVYEPILSKKLEGKSITNQANTPPLWFPPVFFLGFGRTAKKTQLIFGAQKSASLEMDTPCSKASLFFHKARVQAVIFC